MSSHQSNQRENAKKHKTKGLKNTGLRIYALPCILFFPRKLNVISSRKEKRKSLTPAYRTRILRSWIDPQPVTIVRGSCLGSVRIGLWTSSLLVFWWHHVRWCTVFHLSGGLVHSINTLHPGRMQSFNANIPRKCRDTANSVHNLVRIRRSALLRQRLMLQIFEAELL